MARTRRARRGETARERPNRERSETRAGRRPWRSDIAEIFAFARRPPRRRLANIYSWPESDPRTRLLAGMRTCRPATASRATTPWPAQRWQQSRSRQPQRSVSRKRPIVLTRTITGRPIALRLASSAHYVNAATRRLNSHVPRVTGKRSAAV
jgi:hypothetical protein